MNETKNFIENQVTINTRNTYVKAMLRDDDIERILLSVASQTIDEVIAKLSEYAPEFVDEHKDFFIRLVEEIK